MKELFSIHGGHSRRYCEHARDPLEDIIRAYLDRGFSRVGIVEHMPPADDRYLYPEEKAAGLNAGKMRARFREYVREVRSLRQKYADRILIYFGFETESYPGAENYIAELRQEFQPDYIVGSVHHLGDIPIDFSRGEYLRAQEAAGGRDNLYRRYFNRQYELLKTVKPEVVGHFDLIRKYDPDYRSRLESFEIRNRISRNLKLIKKMDLVLELNLRPWFRGEEEPYPTRSILMQACRLGITVIPADDSHEAKSAGRDIEKGFRLLEELGFEPLNFFPDFGNLNEKR